MRAKIARLVIGGILLLPATAWAQEPTSSVITGVVNDTSGAALPGVTVEAASPALIEKARSVVTDGQGRYRIVELRPGRYTITFSLAGFTTFKQEGLELTAGFTATVNADLKVGSIEETITVSSVAPIIDTQSDRTKEVLTREALDGLPNSKTFSTFLAVTPGMSGGGILTAAGGPTRDVGGTTGDIPRGQQIHGSDKGLAYVDGANLMSIVCADCRRINPSDLYTQEIVVENGNGGAEALSGGVNVHFVMKDGGNIFSGVVDGAYLGKGWDSNNLNDSLRARGLTGYNAQDYLYDDGLGLGGPLVKNQLWFYAAGRWWGNKSDIAGLYFNGSPNPLIYIPDLSRPGFFYRRQWDVSGRLTWQAAPNHKVTFSSLNGYTCYCPNDTTGTSIPGAGANFIGYPERVINGVWTHPATSKLLFEAGVTYRNEGTSTGAYNTDPTARSVLDQGTSFTYGAPASGPATPVFSPVHHWYTRGSMSYIGGSHNLKVGFTTLTGTSTANTDANFPEQYLFRNGVPVGVSINAYPSVNTANLNLVLGLYAQEQLSLGRMTLDLGVRFDSVNASVPAQTRPAGSYLPAVSFPEVDNIPNWKDVNPRLGFAYDVFGTGKTVLKASIGRYNLLNNFTLAFTQANSPVAALVTSTTRTWNDSMFGPGDPRTGNLVPDCDLHNPLANGECGAFANQAFGTSVINTTYAADLKQGWGVSPYDWQTSASVQQELRHNVALTLAYYRTWYGNFYYTENQDVTAADFTQYCITAPMDSRLPGGGGYPVCGLYDVSPAKFGKVNNLVVNSNDVGGYSYHYNGLDLLVNGRFGKGGLLMGGVSAGQIYYNICATSNVPPQFCESTSRWSEGTELKISAVYPLPWWNLQVSGTYQNLPGRDQGQNVRGGDTLGGTPGRDGPITFAATNAQIFPSLQRNLAACPAPTGPCSATAVVAIVGPNTLFEPRGNQLDVRLSKIIQMGGRRRLQANFEVYNVTNAADVITLQNTYNPTNFLKPTNILAGRLMKVGANFKF